MKSPRLGHVARNDVKVRTSELLQLGRRVRVTDNGKDMVLRVALLRTTRSISARAYEKEGRRATNV